MRLEFTATTCRQASRQALLDDLIIVRSLQISPVQDASSAKAARVEPQAPAPYSDAPAEQHPSAMQPQLIAAQHRPHSAQLEAQQALPPPTDAPQPPSRLPKPLSLVPENHVEVIQPCHNQPSSQSSRQSAGPAQSQALPVASSGLLSGRDQYEMLRLQSSLIPRQSYSSLTVPSQPQLPPWPQQAAAQPQFVQSVTYASAFAASAVSLQTPQAVSTAQSASQQESVTVRQNSGHAVTKTRQQHSMHSMHQQLKQDGVAGVSDSADAVYQQDQGIKAGQDQLCQSQKKPGIVMGEAQLYDRQGKGFTSEEQPYTIAAMHQQHRTEHAVSRTADGSSTSESHTVASSSSHYEFSFRCHSSDAALPVPGTFLGHSVRNQVCWHEGCSVWMLCPWL